MYVHLSAANHRRGAPAEGGRQKKRRQLRAIGKENSRFAPAAVAAAVSATAAAAATAETEATAAAAAATAQGAPLLPAPMES